MMRRLKEKLYRMPFRRKMIAVYIGLGVTPLVIMLAFLGYKIAEQTRNQSEYALQQNYEQVYLTVSDHLKNMQEIATYLLAENSAATLFSHEGKEMLPGKQLEVFNQVENMRRIFVESSSIDDIYFYLDSSFPMAGSSVGTWYRDVAMLSEEKWCSRMMDGENYNVWAVVREDTVTELENYLSLLQAICDENDRQKVVGMICVSYSLDRLKSIMLPVQERQFFSMEYQGEVLLSAGAEDFPDSLILEKEMPDKEIINKKNTDGKTWYVISREVGDTGIRLISGVREDDIFIGIKKNVYTVIILCIVLLLPVCVLSVILVRGLSDRIIRLARICSDSSSGKMVKIEETAHEDEISQLYHTYNTMVDQIEYLLQEQYRIGQQVKDAQLKALQAQINPHFLYNTLEMVGWMAAREEKKNVQNIVRHLSKYYKSVLNKGKDALRLVDEIQICNSYMEIQNARFKGKINYHCEVEEGLDDRIVPKLILQPLLENAIYHGISKKSEGRGNIWLSVKEQGDRVLLEVSDDGVGFVPGADDEVTGQTSGGSRYGLANIEQRLDIFFKEERCLYVESTPGIGTRVIIDIPKGV